jgi:hypothetical protein
VREQYIIAGSSTLLNALAEVIAADPELALVATSGPAGAPERLVAVLPPDRVEWLRRAFGDQLTIELDEQVSPFT